MLLVKPGELVSSLEQVNLGGFVGVAGSAEIELFNVSDLGQLCGAFLQLVEVVVGSLDLSVALSIFALFKTV